MSDAVQPAVATSRRWRPSPLLAASLLLHVAAPATVAVLNASWPLALGAIAGNHMLLVLAGLAPRSALLGPNLTRLPAAAVARREIALTIDDGPDPQVTPRVLDILDDHGAKASFFCVGERAARHPQLCRQIVERGHAVENHSQRHSNAFSTFGPRRTAADVDDGQLTLQALTGEAPRFFRPTAGLRNVFLDAVLAHRGLQLATWTRRGFDTRERRPDVVLQRLVRHLAAGDVLLLHDGNAARTALGRPVIVDVLPRLLQVIHDAGLRPVTLRGALAA